MTAQNLYNKFLKKEISKEKFLYEVRKQSHLPITKFNSFQDTIQILKTRGLISEEIGKYKTDKNVFFPKQSIKTIDQVSPHEYAKGINYEMDLFDKSVGQNMPKDEELAKVQEKVLKNLTSDEYYYTRKMMSDEQKKVEKSDLDVEELGKDTKAKNQMEKGKMLKENLDQYYSQDDEDLDMDLSQPEGCESCDRDKPELDMDVMDPNELERLSRIIEEWGLTEYDLEDSDVIDELATEFQRRNGELEEIKINSPILLNAKIGNVKKDSNDGDTVNIDFYLGEKKIASGGGFIIFSNEFENVTVDPRIYPDFKNVLNKYGIPNDNEWGLIHIPYLNDTIMRIDNSNVAGYVYDDLEEGIALKDKAGNITYAKDDAEANQQINNARQKNIQLTKQKV